jgi:demethylmenaquinone methyltransferase/2-methoxy-6-polyprenyl-1,4-benzoquinol methylase
VVQKQYVRSIFDSIALRYDMLNHLLSGGIDTYWRRKGDRGPPPRRDGQDTRRGDRDGRFRHCRGTGRAPREIVGVDIAGAMLAIGRTKVRARGLERTISLREGEAESLPFGDAVRRGDRRVRRPQFRKPERGPFAEMRRVLRPGGSIVILEFSRPRTFPFRQMYLAYFLRVIPLVGRLVSGNDQAYAYLPASVMAFPEGREFLAILEETGFRDARAERLTFGIASIYTAHK